MARKRSKQPADVEPVSGSGRLARATDGGASQPPSTFPAEFHGQATQLANQQAASPLAGGGGPSAAPVPGGGSPRPGLPQVFGPTDRPSEPTTAGIGLGPGPGANQMVGPDAASMLTAMFQNFPHPHIMRLIEAQRARNRPARQPAPITEQQGEFAQMRMGAARAANQPTKGEPPPEPPVGPNE